MAQQMKHYLDVHNAFSPLGFDEFSTAIQTKHVSESDKLLLINALKGIQRKVQKHWLQKNLRVNIVPKAEV